MFTIKRGDTSPPISMKITLNDNPFDLTPWTVTWIMEKRPSGTPVISGAMVVDDAPNGKVTYHWQAGDTDVSGLYLAEIRLAQGLLRETIPNAGFLELRIIDPLT